MAHTKLDIAALTFLAEDLGDRDPVPVTYLLVLSRHASCVVREGAVYGMGSALEDARVVDRLGQLRNTDPSKGVRQAAADMLDQA